MGLSQPRLFVMLLLAPRPLLDYLLGGQLPEVFLREPEVTPFTHLPQSTYPSHSPTALPGSAPTRLSERIQEITSAGQKEKGHKKPSEVRRPKKLIPPS